MERILSDFQAQVLIALVDGYEAREGLKDRIRALNEYEIARRSGFTDVSYAGFFEHPTRDRILEALTALQRFGLVTLWERGARYDTFVPTAHGTQLVSSGRPRDEPPASVRPAAPEPQDLTVAATPDPVVERLDEIIRLLKSIESKLGRP